MPIYRERLWPPWWLWLVVVAVAATLAIAVGVPLGGPVGLGVGLLVEAGVVVALLSASTRVEVDATTFTAGRARLPRSAVGLVRPLDADQARRLRGPEADPRAFLVLRGWVASAVRVDLDDRHDPTPYWYVSTRHPDELVEALRTAESPNRRAAG